MVIFGGLSLRLLSNYVDCMRIGELVEKIRKRIFVRIVEILEYFLTRLLLVVEINFVTILFFFVIFLNISASVSATRLMSSRQPLQVWRPTLPRQSVTWRSSSRCATKNLSFPKEGRHRARAPHRAPHRRHLHARLRLHCCCLSVILDHFHCHDR